MARAAGSARMRASEGADGVSSRRVAARCRYLGGLPPDCAQSRVARGGFEGRPWGRLLLLPLRLLRQ
eukprot:12794982-Alexandrium_andersonii.AAC.1